MMDTISTIKEEFRQFTDRVNGKVDSLEFQNENVMAENEILKKHNTKLEAAQKDIRTELDIVVKSNKEYNERMQANNEIHLQSSTNMMNKFRDEFGDVQL